MGRPFWPAWSIFLTRRVTSGNVGRMTKKRLLLIATLPLAIGVTLGVLAMLPPGTGVTKANFDRINEGMTREDVEAIFGGPSAGLRTDFTTGPTIKECECWFRDDGAKGSISFANGHVSEKWWT